MKPAFKREGNLTKQRTVACPTCHVPAGDFCKSVGARGKAAGAIMKTSCHNARIVTAGLTPRDFTKSHKPQPTSTKTKSLARKVGESVKRSEAMRLSWKRRKSLEELMNTPSVVEQAQPTPLGVLIVEALEQLQTKPHLVGASVYSQQWSVQASRTIPEGFNISIVKR